jgi:hypothetical protein
MTYKTFEDTVAPPEVLVNEDGTLKSQHSFDKDDNTLIRSQEQQARPATAEVSQNLTAWPITIDGKEHAIRISKAGNPVCDCGTASNHPHHIPAKTLENAFPPDHDIFKALPPSRLAELAKLEVEQEANELRFRLAEAERQQKERAERERLCLKFPGLNEYFNYEYGKSLPGGLVSIPTDGSIRRIKKAGIEYIEIVEVVYTGRCHVPRVRGYAVRESDSLLVQCNFDHEKIVKVIATESDSQK